MIGMGRLLGEVANRLHQKTHLRLMTKGWERRIGIVMEDSQTRWQLTFSGGGAFCGEWTEGQSADLIVQGGQRQVQMLFGGDELVYAFAKQQVKIVGSLRDQLKLDAILRLTCK
ncbi:SCP2 sterol-binding domain-containing protein [Brevibacillus sp. NRS-1366]|uniref:SCP2 sterol-binding domain-containing protein n=1 Tax=Brevibacillus sp. NRS-1366 TaxID=3233899 RepID=UPI003D23D16A